MYFSNKEQILSVRLCIRTAVTLEPNQLHIRNRIDFPEKLSVSKLPKKRLRHQCFSLGRIYSLIEISIDLIGL